MNHISKNKKLAPLKFVSHSAGDTAKIAGLLAEKIKPNKKSATVVALSGELGAGKTHLVQYVAKVFGIKKKLASPTFVIMKFYRLPLIRGSAQRARGFKTQTPPNPPLVRGGETPNFKKLIHIDAYRLKNSEELLKLGWKEILKDPENLVFIEWPENVAKAMPKNPIKISILHHEQDSRKISIKFL